MKKWLGLILLLLALAGVGYWVWVTFFPSLEIAIRKRFTALAEVAAIPPNEPPLAKLANAQKLGNFFTTDVDVTVEVPGRSQQSFSGREELVQAAAAARSSVSALNIEFLDVIVALGPDNQTATVNLTARARIPGDRDFYIQELKFSLKKVNGDWMIYKVETVKTLSFHKNAKTKLLGA